YDELYIPYGYIAAGQGFSLMAQRHMVEFGTTQEQLAEVALTCRKNANDSPAAMMHDRKMTMEDYLSSRMVATPLRLFDYCLENDGACAAVITSAERAKDCA